MIKRLLYQISSLISAPVRTFLDHATRTIKGEGLIQQNEALRFYRKVKYQKHIFIFSVLGRSSSTALQRILNSSSEICVFGETRTILEKLIAAFTQMEYWEGLGNTRNHLRKLRHGFQTGRHDQPYPHALNLEAPLDLMPGIIASLFRPLIGVKRFGFKEIERTELEIIRTLKRLFPKSRIVFLFRDPLEQFSSICSTDWWEFSKDLDDFIEAYALCADIYRAYGREDFNAIFIENKHLYNLEAVSRILQFLSISDFDRELINDRVFSFDSKPRLEPSTRDRIMGSPAYEAYQRMRELCDSFIQGIGVRSSGRLSST